MTASMDLLAKVLWARERPWIAYAAGLAADLAGLALDLHLRAILATATFLVFFPGIFIAAVIGGIPAGAVSALFAAGLVMFFILPPLHSLAVAWPGAAVEVALFLAVTAALIALIDYTVAVSARLRQTNAGLAAQAQQRTAQLVAKEALIQTFFEHSPQYHVVFVVDPDGQFRYEEVNPATLKLYGKPRAEIIGRRLEDLFDPATAAELHAHLARCLRENEPIHYERIQGDNIIEALASPVPADAQAAVAGTPSRVIVTAGDVTARRQLEQQLRQSQKMEAVGQLTGGLAHDFNNLLTGISGSLELMETRLAQGRLDQLPRYLQTATSAAKRAAALTHRLLAFSRRQTLEPRPTDINRLIADLDDLIRRTAGPGIIVELIAAADLWPSLIDQNQLENAVLNLSINARDAMPTGGRLTIATGNETLDARAASTIDLPPGQYVRLTVSDTGCGMPPDIAARAFDPFFTTKPLGAGTGLGLSMVYGFARQSGGTARIVSEPGPGPNAGTAVSLYLPRFGKTADAPEAPEIAPIAAAPSSS